MADNQPLKVGEMWHGTSVIPMINSTIEADYTLKSIQAGKATVEMKAFTGVTGDAGGFAVPREIDAAIETMLKAASPIRAIANVVKVGTAGYRKLVTTGGTPSGWAAETQARPETATPVFSEIAPPMALPACTTRFSSLQARISPLETLSPFFTSGLWLMQVFWLERVYLIRL